MSDKEERWTPTRLTAVYGSKSKKAVHVGAPGGSTLLVVRNGEYGDNFDIVRAMVDAYNAMAGIEDPAAFVAAATAYVAAGKMFQQAMDSRDRAGCDRAQCDEYWALEDLTALIPQPEQDDAE